MLKALYALLLALLVASPAGAAAPSTLGYQGRLATSGGQPISANLSITFRLFDVASGGSALWTETQPSVPVDGGNLAVELGKVTPLPASIWGKQLYLGVQVAGDSEMLPRPPLTAAPFALRAATTMKNTIFVSAEGTPTDMGIALLAAAATAATNPGMAIELDAGTYDLGSAILDVPPQTTLSGRSQLATTITSTNTVGAVRLASNTSARDFTAVANGSASQSPNTVVGVTVDQVVPDGTPIANVRIERVTGIADGPVGATGGRAGFYICALGSRFSGVTGSGQGGQFGYGIRADCPNGQNNIFEHVVVQALLSSDGLRGAYFAGGNSTWHDIKADVTFNSAVPSSAYGIRLFGSNIDGTAVLSDAIVNIHGNDIPQTVQTFVDGVRIENANVDLERVRVNVDGTRVSVMTGVRITSVTGNHIVQANDLTVLVRGVQVPFNNFGSIDGILAVNAAPQISRSKIAVRCSAGGTYRCNGIARRTSAPAGLQSGAIMLDHVEVSTAHENPADGSAFAYAFDTDGSARISGSTLRALRSPQGETAGTTSARTGADIRISDSSLIVESTVTPTNDCAIGGAGAVELYSSDVQGSSCVEPNGTTTCAGNTKRGVGFLASACP